MNPLGVLADIFVWTGFAGAALFGLLALILRIADGTWLPVRAVVEDLETGSVARWIDVDGVVGEAPLSEHDRAELGSRDMADLYARRGRADRVRRTPGSPAVRATAWLAAGLAGLGVVAFAVSMIMLAVER